MQVKTAMRDYKSDSWVNGQGVFAGRQAFIRKNVSLSQVCKADYPTGLLISLVYHEKKEDGLPSSSDELQRLDTTEESVADYFCSRFQALFAMCVTADGTRDIFLYLPGGPAEEQIARAFEACDVLVDYDFSIQPDPQWHPYSTLLSDPVESSSEQSPAMKPWWKVW